MDVSSEVRWSPGEYTAFAWADGFALLAPSIEASLAERLRLLLQGGSELGAFVRALAHGTELGFLDLPPFGVAIRDGDRWHLAVRGEVAMAFQRGRGMERLTGVGVPTWDERVISGVVALRIGWPQAEGESYQGGLVAAAGIGFGAFADAEPTSAPRRLRQEPEPEPEADYLGGDTVDDEVSPSPQFHGAVRLAAKYCSRLHPNPPDRARCFICDDLVAGPLRQARRPQLGWLRAPHKDPIALNGPVVVGRHPTANALPLDEPPELLTLSYRHVSGNHLAILLDGWRVLVQDLESTNGTCLRRRAKLPVRLPHQAITLLPGDVIDLGHDLLLHLDRIP